MNKFWIMLAHTYMTTLKKKSFLITTGVMLAIILLLSNLASIMAFFDKENEERIGVYDASGQYYDLYSNELKNNGSDIVLEKISGEAEGKEWIKEEKIQGYLTISEGENGMPSGVYHSNTISDEAISESLSAALTGVKNKVYTDEKLDVSEENLAQLYMPASFEKQAIQDNAKSEAELNAARGLVYIMLLVIYMGVITYAGMIASEVAGEKTSRVMEILISSVSPVHQMFAKILGIGLISLTQMLVLLGAGYFSVQKAMEDLPGGVSSILSFDDTSAATVVYAIIFALLGYLLYATLAAFLGSLVSRVEDVQSVISPMIMLVVVAFVMAMSGLGNPEAGFITVSSFIPPFTPMLMFLRVGMLDVPMWEVALSISLLLATIILLGIFGARVYKGGVLMYGQGSFWKSIRKALELSKKE